MITSARELLEQADTLMRKNRARDDVDIPVLVDDVETVSPLVGADVADVPILTDIVEDAGLDRVTSAPNKRPPLASFEGDPSDWLVMDTIDPATHSITGRAPDTLGAAPAFTLKAAGSAATPPPARSAPPVIGAAAEQPSPGPVAVADGVEDDGLGPPAQPLVGEPPPPQVASDPGVATVASGAVQSHAQFAVDDAQAIADDARDAAKRDEEKWQALAEQISMQVLQRVDLFTDAGLKVQLADRLQPIVAHASGQLVETITGQVGQLLRTYVAEAIEREIAAWRRGHR